MKDATGNPKPFCANWTSIQYEEAGAGYDYATTYQWSYAYAATCSDSAHLYCFEQ